MDIKAPRGTFDILPDNAKKRDYIESLAADVFESYGYQRIITPVFERTELFARGIGEATEIVQKEMYTFTDKSGRSLTLRPEGTAPVVRAFIEHNMQGLSLPVKLYYCGPMWRYERPQAGRYREFWQLGVEALGSDDPVLDAEIITLLSYLYKRLGLDEIDLLVNSMGCRECRGTYVVALKEYLSSLTSRLCEDCRQRATINPLRAFDCKNETCISLVAEAPKIDQYWCEKCRRDFAVVLSCLESVGLAYRQAPELVRGFDYYTRTTFEVQSPLLGAQNAIGGGGRYDNLMSDYGGPSMPGIGFAIGTDRLLLALEAQGIVLPTYDLPGVFFIAVDPPARTVAFQLAFDLRRTGIYAELDFMERSLKSQLKQADRVKAAIAVIIGSDELNQGICQVKDMATGEQEPVKQSRLVEYIKKRVNTKETEN